MASHDEELCAVLTSVALAGDGLVLGLGMAMLAVRTWMKFRSHSRALKQVQETPLSRIADLRSLVQIEDQRYEGYNMYAAGDGSQASTSKDGSNYGGNSTTMSSGKSEEQTLVIVRGKIQAKAMVELQGKANDSEVLVTHNVHEKGVFLERTQTYLYNEWRGFFGWGSEWRGFMGWVPVKDQVTVSQWKGFLLTNLLLTATRIFSNHLWAHFVEVPFVLTDSQTYHDSHRESYPQMYVHINLDEIRHPLPLVTVYHNLNPVPASSHTILQAMFGRRYPVGLLDEEKILPIGQEITAVGILTSSPDGIPMIKSSRSLPYFLTDGTRDQLLSQLASGTKVLMWTGIAVSAVAAGILGYACFKNWTKWTARQRERQRQEEESQHDRILVEYELEDITDIPDGELCVVCLLRRRRAAFISCGHRVCCIGCAQRVEQGTSPRCPVCRQAVTSFIRVYDS